jgi:glycogen debranching enzyme
MMSVESNRHGAARDRAAGATYAPVNETPGYEPRTLKVGDTFAVFDPFGDIQAAQATAEGLFHNDTRYLSQSILLIEGRRPLLLSSRISEDNAAFVADLTNSDIVENDTVRLPRDSVHILRAKTLASGGCFECIKLQNYRNRPIEVGITMQLAADFADIFEVRRTTRPRRGRLLEPRPISHGLVLSYVGLDDCVRRARLTCDPLPALRSGSSMTWRVRLGPGEFETIQVAVHCETGDDAVASRDLTYLGALREHRRWSRQRRHAVAQIRSSNERFNDWMNRSRADLDMLLTLQPDGPIAHAGIPWFNTVFGRDALITAWQTLWLDPELARGTLAGLAATQATILDPARDAEPGKILHETRNGEMARLGEVPFARYYGSADATPLFVMLAAAYYQRTGDGPFIERLWPNIRAALDWIERYGDGDGDGFIEYRRNAAGGLTNQGWKDSESSIFHADGSLAEGPIALCEVQAYAYAAWRGAATLARAIGEGEDVAAEWESRAEALLERFDEAFWCDDLGSYALALDGRKRPCRVRTSNAGHALVGGVAKPERAARLAATLMDRSSWTGWGIRTVAEGEALYNPMSYHNGSVWPHDVSLIAAGLARYGFQPEAVKLLNGLFEASLFMPWQRLPELFCGFARKRREAPTAYPVACAPQAWASGAGFALLSACLGISFVGAEGRILLKRPMLPPEVDEVYVENLHLAGGRVDLLFRRHTRDVAVNVVEKEGEIEVVLVS